jgi:hypothetical protein
MLLALACGNSAICNSAMEDSMATRKTTGTARPKAPTRKPAATAAAHAANKVPAAAMTPSPAGPNAIADLAYQLFLQRGAQHGYDLEDWVTAERLLTAG